MKDRLSEILKALDEQGEVDVSTLTSLLGASEATVRRDLTTLQEEGQLIRTRGGARRISPLCFPAPEMEAEKHTMREEKRRVAAAALSMIEPGMTIALDRGPIISWMLSGLRYVSDVTVITNSLEHIWELGACNGLTVICIGGELRPGQRDFVGPRIIQRIREWHADLAFLTVDSLRPGKGVFRHDQLDATLSASIADSSDSHVALMTHDKMNSRGTCLSLPTTDVDVLVMDSSLDTETRRLLIESEPYRLVLA